MKTKTKQKPRKWNGLWFEPESEHISRFNYGPKYRRLTGFARKLLGLDGKRQIKPHTGRIPFAWEN